jgi:hypothetical protein
MLKGGLNPDVFTSDDLDKLKAIIELENQLMDAIHPKIVEQFTNKTKDLVYQRPSCWLKMVPSPEAQKLYRRLSKVHHPDKGGDTSKFMLITKARDDNDVELLTKMCTELAVIDEEGSTSGPNILDLFGRIPEYLDDARWGWFRGDGIGALIQAQFVKK